ncbi:MAG: LacI family transcriptional regulator [Spirochaetia bacterium]|nr:LacI family transcriptional regulator [Spirochaetia bacterium]
MNINFKKIGKILDVSEETVKLRLESWKEKSKKSSQSVNLKLVAALCDVSISTVSNYFNDKKGSISKELASQLDQLVIELGYYPSTAAKKLRSSDKMSIAYIAPISQSPSTEYYIDILKGIKSEADKFGYYIDIYDVGEGREKEFFNKAPFLGLVDGVIVVSSVVTGEDLIPLKNMHLPVFHINPRKEDTDIPFVGSAFSEVGEIANLMEHVLVEQKCKNPVLLSVKLNNYNQREEKYNYFIEALKKNGIDFSEDKNVVFLDTYSYAEGKKAYIEALKKNPKTDAFICLSDIIAVPVLRSLEMDNRNAVVTGYANFEIAELFALTTIDQNIEELGATAFQRLYFAIKYIQHNSEFPQYTKDVISTKFIKRKSYIGKM